MMIDLRSDTVTKPCDAMRKVMSEAEVGDDVYDEDPTVKRLESELSERAGHEAGLYFPSGTQSNLVALLTHCQRGDEYIVGQNAHTYRYEAGGAAVLGSIQPQPIENADDGTIPLEKIKAAIKDLDFHFAKSRVLALENTTGGKCLSQSYISQARRLASEHGLVFHLDGARAFNAAVGQNLSLADVCSQFDSVSLCLSKGLGAPVGSVMVSNSDVIEEAKRWRKMVGGGMRQAGIIAAAGLYAINNNIDRLAEDHDRAQRLAKGLEGIDGLSVEGGMAHTNMVYLSAKSNPNESFLAACSARGVLFSGADISRLVIHSGINDEMIERAISVIRGYFDT